MKNSGAASLRKALLMDCGQGVASFVGAGGKTTLMFRLARELADAEEPVLTTTTTKIAMPDKSESAHVIFADSACGILKNAEKQMKTGFHVTAVSGRPNAGKLAGLPPEIVDKVGKSGMFRWILVEADGAARMPLKAPAAHEPVIPESTNRFVGVIGLDSVRKPLKNPYVFRPEIFSKITGLALGEMVTEESVAACVVHKNGLMKNCPPNAVRILFLNKTDLPGKLSAAGKIAEILERSDYRPERIIVGNALENATWIMV